MVDFKSNYVMSIDGRRVESARRIPVVDPATGEIFAEAPDCTRDELDAAVSSAAIAFEPWQSTPLHERQSLLRQAADALAAHVDALANVFTREHGRPLIGARQEIEGAVSWLHAVANMEPPVHVSEDSAAQLVETRYVPLGVICAIAPWNFPVSLAIWKVAPALLAGNTMVLKPSPFSPLCTLRIGEILNEILPRGVLNVVSGGDDLGPMMTAHEGFAKIAFTGSTATGKRVMASAARGLKRITLELGGNDPAIVLPDVDVDAVAPKIFFNAFYNSSQICVATKRLYAHEDVYEPLRDRLFELARRTRVGNGFEEGVELGPVQNRRQYERVRDLLADARSANLTLLQGAEVPARGFFVPITIVDNPPDDSKVVTEEAFGPVLPMLKFRDIDEVLRRVNDSPYGLGASVWSNDRDVAVAVARRIRSGTVWINQVINLRPDTPFCGHKSSGLGVENGLEGLLEYMAPQAVYVARG